MTFTPSSTAGREGQITWNGMEIVWDKSLSDSESVAVIIPARRIRAMKRASSHIVQRTTILSNQIVDIKGNHE